MLWLVELEYEILCGKISCQYTRVGGRRFGFGYKVYCKRSYIYLNFKFFLPWPDTFLSSTFFGCSCVKTIRERWVRIFLPPSFYIPITKDCKVLHGKAGILRHHWHDRPPIFSSERPWRPWLQTLFLQYHSHLEGRRIFRTLNIWSAGKMWLFRQLLRSV